MRYSEVANRYAIAIYQLAQESQTTAAMLSNLKELELAIKSDKMVGAFVNSPLIPAAEKEKLFKKTLGENGAPETLINFVALLSRKGRLLLLSEIIAAYQACDDTVNKIARGAVRSATNLSASQKGEISQIIAMITKKKVVLSFEEDKSYIGGLVAQVGSMTFDDTLTAHVQKIKEDLNRRIN